MGKSPGKWIKAVLFGKKAFKSNSSRRREIPKSAYEKASATPSEESVSNLAVDVSFTSETAPVSATNEHENLNSRNDEVSGLSNELTLASSQQDGNVQTAADDALRYDSDRIRLELAATKAQATFRGYLARRAFRTLKGIIRLQAVIRGHLVRRQAVATLYCVHGIIKFQALVRGQIIRGSNISSGVQGEKSLPRRNARLDSSKANTYSGLEKLLKNAFIRRLLSSSPTSIPLRLQYDPKEPNSAWNWLLRWTVSRVWGPLCEPQVTINMEHIVETQKVGQKRTGNRKKKSANVENASEHPSLELETFKNNPRRASNQSVKSLHEQPKNEIDKVNHNPKKISSFASESPVQTDVKAEKKKRNHNSGNAEKKTALPMADDSITVLHGSSVSDGLHKQVGEKNETISNIDRDFNSVEQTSNENHRISKRRASLPAKRDDQESEHRGRRARSYMAATQSAKAKVRGQVSPRVGQDVGEKNGVIRRHSLPYSINGKSNSSPQVQKLVQA